jgi:hypothetical protein
MHGQSVGGGQSRRTLGRRRTATLVLAAFLAYNAPEGMRSMSALFVAVRAQVSVPPRGHGEPVADDRSPGDRRASNGVEVPRLNRSPRPGETAFVAGNRSAAEPVRSRTTEGNRRVCGELNTGEGWDGCYRA